MCGKLNPAELDVCQYCQARLKPLKIERSPEDEAPRPGDAPAFPGEAGLDAGSPDWWQSWRDAAEEAQPEAEGEADDWIGDLRDQPSFDESAERIKVDWPSGVDRVIGVEEETSDWLSRIRDDASTVEPGEEPSQRSQEADDQEVSDWLRRGEEAEAPDWLTGIKSQAALPPSEEEGSTEDGTGLPGWLASVDEQAGAPPEPDEDLLQRLAGSEIEDAAPESPKQRTGLTGMLSWLQRPEPADVPDSETPQTIEDESAPDVLPDEEPGGEDLPDWLAGEQAEETEGVDLPDWLAEEAPETGPEEAGDVEVPDWVAEEEPVEIEPVDLPEWLAEETLDTEEVEPGDEELPGWLAESEAVELEGERLPDSLVEQTPVAAEEEAAGEVIPDWLIGSEEEELPDWLADEQAMADAMAPAAIESSEEAVPDWLLSSEEELPDWLAGEEAELAEGDEPGIRERPTQEQPEAGAITEEQVGDEVYDMMASLSRQTAMVDQGFSAQEEEEIEEDLDWLADLESAYPDLDLEELQPTPISGDAATPLAEDSQAGEEPSFDEDLPEWLSGVAVGEGELEEAPPDVSEEPAEIEAEGDLTPAELPSWLEAMRPIAAAAAAVQIMEEDAEPEGAGPLAGLKGVLRAEPGISYARKPPTYSVKLRATENQQANAEILRKLIEAEGVAQPIPSAPVVTSQYILRVAIFVVLVLTILGALIVGVPQLEIPMIPSVSADALAVSQLISNVPAGSPVLVAVDYEPGLIGEMDVYTGIVLEHLLEQGAFITFVSTSPTGPVQAERLVAKVNRSVDNQYRAPGNYLNLGFIPGGPAGLLSFSANPQQALPRSLDGQQAWQEPAIAGIQDLSGFAMVVVATENPATARAWIEQIQPRIGAAPMVLVASAQAEPIVRPYYEGFPQQVQGLLSGPAASGAYLNLTHSIDQDDARVYWAPFSLGALIVSILMLVGGGMNAIMAMFKQRKEVGEGEG